VQPQQTSPGNPGADQVISFAKQIEGIVDSKLSAYAKLGYIKIRLRADHRTLDRAWPSLETLMQAMSVKDPRTARRALGELSDRMLLDRKERPGKTTEYVIPREQFDQLIADSIRAAREKRGSLSATPIIKCTPYIRCI
jgi:hypothetical protein